MYLTTGLSAATYYFDNSFPNLEQIKLPGHMNRG
jgi:hypothetical protein